MDIELAIKITNVADAIDDFQEPSERLPDRMAEAMFAAQEKREALLDDLCLVALRQMILAEARRTLAEIPPVRVWPGR